MIVNRHRGSGFHKAKFGDMLIDVVDDSLVFFRLDAAGAVHAASASLQDLNRCLHYPALELVDEREILRRQAPSHIGSSPNNSGICARSVDQDCIERFGLERRCVLKPVRRDNGGIADTKTDQILLETSKSRLVVIA